MLTLQRLGRGPTALQPGGHGRLAGLVLHTAARSASTANPWRYVPGSINHQTFQVQHSCRTRVVPMGGSNTDGTMEPTSASDNNGAYTSGQVLQLLRDAVALTRQYETQSEATKDDSVYVILLAAFFLATESVKGINRQWLVWDDGTPLYFGVLQAASVLGWLYIGLRAAGFLNVSVAPPQTEQVQQLRAMIQALQPTFLGSVGLPSPDQGSQARIARIIKQLQTDVTRLEKGVHLQWVQRRRTMAWAVQCGTCLCRVLLEEYTKPAPRTQGLLLSIAQGIAAVVCFYYIF